MRRALKSPQMRYDSGHSNREALRNDGSIAETSAVLTPMTKSALDNPGNGGVGGQGVVDEKILEDGGGARAAAAVAPESKVFDFWGVANALADTVKKTTADISARLGSRSFITAACSLGYKQKMLGRFKWGNFAPTFRGALLALLVFDRRK